MKHFLLACALAVSGAASAQPGPRCDGAAPAAGAQGACPKAAPAVTAPSIAPSLGKTENPEANDPRQTPYKAGLKQQCDAMAQVINGDKLTPDQEAQVRAQHRAFRC